jgi:predicted nucleotidyltransferase
MAYYSFSPKLEEPFSLVHPLKTKELMQLVGTDMPCYIDLIILFGSSLDLTCTPYSDVDLYIISDKKKESHEFVYKRCKELKIKADILSADTESFMEDALDINSIEREILESGLVIYEKKSNPV